MTEYICAHTDLIKYISEHPDKFTQKEYKFTVSIELFNWYDRLIPDSDNELDEIIETPNEEESAAIKWMHENNVYLIWDTKEDRYPYTIIRQVVINGVK